MLEIDEDGTRCWYNEKGEWHREDGPAIEWFNGEKLWLLNGKRHRIDGPAIEYNDGHKEWYLNGELHRIGGPAVEWSNGNRFWFLNDKEYSEEEYREKVGEIC